jgi:hypothetical protein
MKRSLLAIALGLILGAGTANAEVLDTFNILNPDTNTFVTVNELDWNSSGVGLAEGLGPFGTAITAGTNFTFDYMADLTGVNNPAGDPITFTGLASTFEYTVVAKFGETVIQGASSIFDTALFSTTGGSWAIYVNPTTTNADYPTGTGFDDGTLVASGTIDPNQVSSFTITGAALGTGGSIIFGLIDYINPTYLDPISAGLGLPLFDFRFEGSQNFPSTNTPSDFFAGGSATVYPTVPVGTDDLLLKVDGSSKFSVVPEPSTYLLFGMGLLGLVGFNRRRMQK